MSLSSRTLEKVHYFQDLKGGRIHCICRAECQKRCFLFLLRPVVNHALDWQLCHSGRVWEVRELRFTTWKVVSRCFLVYDHARAIPWDLILISFLKQKSLVSFKFWYFLKFFKKTTIGLTNSDCGSRLLCVHDHCFIGHHSFNCVNNPTCGWINLVFRWGNWCSKELSISHMREF